jgi:uncharacterized membrane protein YphA (DoxX/SURF4 family)
MNRWTSDPRFLWASRIFLGAIFLYAGLPKLMDLAGFAGSIQNYALVPEGFIHVFAAILAGLEVATGAALVTGRSRRGASLAVTAMLLMFIGAIFLAYSQGRSIDCGCFTSELSLERSDEIREHMRLRIYQDLGMLLLAVNLMRVEWNIPFEAGDSADEEAS